MNTTQIKQMEKINSAMANLQRETGKADLTLRQVNILMFLAENPGASVRDVERGLEIPFSSASKNVNFWGDIYRKDVQGMGMVTQKFKEGSKKTKAFTLNQKGQKLLANFMVRIA